MFKRIGVLKHSTKRGRPFTRFVCPHDGCNRGCRTEQGLKAHITRLHGGERHTGELMSRKAHPKATKHTNPPLLLVATDTLTAARQRIAENIKRLEGELADIDKAIEVCERHLGGE